MTEKYDDFNSIRRTPPLELSTKELHNKRFQPRLVNQSNNQNKAPLRVKVSKPPKTSVKLKPTQIQIHFKWALILTIFCFFTIGPIWALYKTSELRRMIQEEELEAATRLSHKISTTLLVSTVLGIIVWVAVLFCTAGPFTNWRIIKVKYNSDINNFQNDGVQIFNLIKSTW